MHSSHLDTGLGRLFEIQGFLIFDGTIRASRVVDGTRVACGVTNAPDGIDQDCAAAVGLTVHTYGMLA